MSSELGNEQLMQDMESIKSHEVVEPQRKSEEDNDFPLPLEMLDQEPKCQAGDAESDDKQSIGEPEENKDVIAQ